MIQIFVLVGGIIFGIFFGIFISPKFVLKTAGVLIALLVVGLIISLFLSEYFPDYFVGAGNFVWYFGVSAIAVGFIAIPVLIGSYVALLVKQAISRGE
jgi:hypothetical protein